MAPRSSITPFAREADGEVVAIHLDQVHSDFCPGFGDGLRDGGMAPVPSMNPQQRTRGAMVMSKAPSVSALRCRACSSRRNRAGETRTGSRGRAEVEIGNLAVGTVEAQLVLDAVDFVDRFFAGGARDFGRSPWSTISKRVAMAWRASVTGGMGRETGGE